MGLKDTQREVVSIIHSIWIRSQGKCECSALACGDHMPGKCGAFLRSGAWWAGEKRHSPAMLEALCETCSDHSLRRIEPLRLKSSIRSTSARVNLIASTNRRARRGEQARLGVSG